MFLRRCCVVLVVGCGIACAQQLSPPVRIGEQARAATPSGSVSGTVIAADTQQPARFASVYLQAVPTSTTETGRGGFGFGGGFTQARTEVDGTFLATGVPVGDYYVFANAPGYIPERAVLQAEMNAGATPDALLAQIPIAHVVADATSSISVTMQRGGAISGRVVWEDGSPAAGQTISAIAGTTPVGLPTQLAMIQSPGGTGTFAQTDDRGAFRITGLASGSYIVMVTIQSRTQFGGGPGGGRGGQGSTIRVYAPSTFRRAEAKAISVKAGDERSDVQLVIDLRGLHTVSGHATSSAPGVNVASGRVSLSDPADPSLQLNGSVDEHGAFEVKYVPPGSYTLTISGANSLPATTFRGRGGDSTGTGFQTFTQTEVVGETDLSGVAASLTPTQAAGQSAR